ncbi:hypothetical protein [Rhizobium sp. 'Codium 1']|uniref:hypothetical protein n=1 Tax=Rhizobium sp. 'Codium 1' TaxID=2940484 RepID=UPI001E2F17AD|nr:hypothetical protein [Rhizobium sp. 'Codium 1']MCC8930999.1 hypothetical protein [Rhizobium sp. 'Codium 1']
MDSRTKSPKEETLSPRLRSLKAALIDAIPCAPDEEKARADLASEPLAYVIKHYMAWIDRLISKRPRRVEFASDFWKDALPDHLLPRLADLMQVFTTGEDLSPYLSRYVQTHGYVQQLSKKRRGPAWADGGSGSLDFAVNMFDIHHFHFTPAHGGKRKGQSDALLFASVHRDNVRFLMVGDHKSFDSEALRKRAAAARHAEGMALKGVTADQGLPDDIGHMLRRGLMVTDTVHGEAVPLGLTALDGTSLWTVRHVSKVMGLLHDYDAKLDTPTGRSEFANLMNVVDDLEGLNGSLSMATSA